MHKLSLLRHIRKRDCILQKRRIIPIYLIKIPEYTNSLSGIIHAHSHTHALCSHAHIMHTQFCLITHTVHTHTLTTHTHMQTRILHTLFLSLHLYPTHTFARSLTQIVHTHRTHTHSLHTLTYKHTSYTHSFSCSLVALASSQCCSVLQCVAVCCSVLQCVAVCCSVLQCDNEIERRRGCSVAVWCRALNTSQCMTRV